MRRALMISLLLLTACGEEAASTEDPPSTETQPAAETAEADPHPAEDPADPPPEVEAPYDEDADAQADIDAALASAGADNKRVLLMFGANWCPWCRRLEHTFRNAPDVTSELTESYHLIHVDIGARHSDTNRDVARRYGDPLSQGLPCLVVLNADGSVAHVQETGSLEDGDRHDPPRVLAFLRQWRLPAGDDA
ncbi:MAG: thioredoxin family protein [Sandaracinaceae bacterium]